MWPERENPLVVRVNRLMDRGLIDGIRTGEGNNGWQLILEGTRPAQGQTYGIGYRRADLFNDLLTARATARGTFAGAQLYDGELQLNRLGRSEHAFLNGYVKYERSPHMDYYGLGADSRKDDRTRYQLNTALVETRAGYRFTPALNAGIEFGYGGAHTGSVDGDEIPSIETKFDATTAPGLFDDTRFSSWGAFVGFDVRDLKRGPRSGGFYGIEFKRYVDMDEGTYSHRQLDLEGQQFFPYLNQQRVVALFVKARFAYTGDDDRVVPFYLLPQLGGNFELRGFNQYRFSDNNTFMASIEHRWYAFSGLEMALFLDAGKSVRGERRRRLLRIELQRRHRAARPRARRGRDAHGRGHEPRGHPLDLVHERRVAETVLVAVRRPLPRVARVLATPRPRDRHRSRPGGGAAVLSRRPAAARADAPACARSRGAQFQRAARGR